jgi:methylmalonyl-CoA mutase N-terminal domain/subunit
LKEYQAQKEFVFPPRQSMRLVRDTIAFTAAEMPKWNSISVSGYHIREAGSTAAEELAFTLANGFAYVELAQQAGLSVDEVAPRLSFFFNAHIDFFEEIAKYRAARRLWATWMKGPLRATNELSWKLRFHTQTAGVSLTAQQPESQHRAHRHRSLGRRARRHAVAPHELHGRGPGAAVGEGGAHRAAHPASHRARDQRHQRRRSPGRIVVRRGPDRRDGRAGRSDLRRDPEMGEGSMLEGCIRGIEDNWFQGRIAESAYNLERSFNQGKRIVVGVNDFTEGNDDADLEILRITNEDERKQVGASTTCAGTATSRKVLLALEELTRDAEDPEVNLMPALINAVAPTSRSAR